MQLRQKVVVPKIRKFPISVETQLSAAARQIKHMLCESALTSNQTLKIFGHEHSMLTIKPTNRELDKNKRQMRRQEVKTRI